MAAISASDQDSSAIAAAALAVVKFHVHIEIGTFEGILISLVRSFSLAEIILGAANPATPPAIVFSIKTFFSWVISIGCINFFKYSLVF